MLFQLLFAKNLRKIISGLAISVRNFWENKGTKWGLGVFSRKSCQFGVGEGVFFSFFLAFGLLNLPFSEMEPPKAPLTHPPPPIDHTESLPQ